MIIYPFLYFTVGSGLALVSTILTRGLREKHAVGELGYYSISPQERRIHWMVCLFFFWPVVLGLVLPLMGLLFALEAICSKTHDFLVWLEKATRGKNV